MALKDLTQYLTPDLQIPYGGKTYTVTPPSKENGRKLAAINAIGVATYAASLTECPTCGRHGSPEIPKDTQALLEEMKDDDVAVLALGQATLDEMLADGVPGAHVDKFAMYALYYWTLGEQAADAIFAAQSGPDALGEALGTGPTSTPKGGHRMASGNQTRRASSRPTGQSRKR